VQKKENLRRVKSFNFGKLNNYQLFNVLFPLHNSALAFLFPRFMQQEGYKNNGQPWCPPLFLSLSLSLSQHKATYTEKKDNGSLWIINISVSVFPSILPTCATSQTTVKKFYVMMLLGVESEERISRIRRRKKMCI
jgi:hypothetical protein